MKPNKYQEAVKRTTKFFGNKWKELANLGLGISGEAGDVAGCIKKTLSHQNDQVAGIKENLGDTLWYIAAICNHFDWNLEEVMFENIEKLKKRYPNGFIINEASRDGKRTDWMEENSAKGQLRDENMKIIVERNLKMAEAWLAQEDISEEEHKMWQRMKKDCTKRLKDYPKNYSKGQLCLAMMISVV